MPNGRSGGFMIDANDLRQLIADCPAGAVVGKLPTGGRLREVTTSEILGYIDERRPDQVAVEEQHEEFYIIHLGDAPTILRVAVYAQSPLFHELQLRHAQWTADHPGWKGWIGF